MSHVLSSIKYIILCRLLHAKIIIVSVHYFKGGITIIDLQINEIKQRLKETISEGLDDEYINLVKDLRGSYRLEEIAVAAVYLYAEQGSKRDVRRRTLKTSEFVPLRSKDIFPAKKKKPNTEDNTVKKQAPSGQPRPAHPSAPGKAMKGQHPKANKPQQKAPVKPGKEAGKARSKAPSMSPSRQPSKTPSKPHHPK